MGNSTVSVIVKGPGRTGHWTVALFSEASSQRSNLEGRRKVSSNDSRGEEERWDQPPLNELDKTELDEDVGVGAVLLGKRRRKGFREKNEGGA